MSEAAVINNNEKETLKDRFLKLKQEQPGLRARNAAEMLGISEAELLLINDDAKVTVLQKDPQEILKQVITLDEVMALTRNEYCVHERKGIYDNASFFSHGPMKQGLFVNPDIDLRLFMNHWQFCFAVIEASDRGDRKSLQFFDKSGSAVHKVYVTTKSDEAAYTTLVEQFRADEQPESIQVEDYDPKPDDLPDDEIDWKGFRQTWENLKDTHDFFPMLKKFNVGREQALRHIGVDFAYQVGNDASRRILELARDSECEIMVFVGNRGCIQIHTGPVRKLLQHGDWYNVMDPMFNLHLQESNIARTWVTKKPTVDGTVTALEVFDDDGELIVTFFGKRKPGIPELQGWRDIIDQVQPLEHDHAA